MQFKFVTKYQPWLLGVVWLSRLPNGARGEEQSILKDAQISDYEMYTMDPTISKLMLIDENF